MMANHGRKLVLGAVALVPGRVRHAAPVADDVREQVESMMIRSGLLDNAPFEWVGLVLRYGKRNADRPKYEAINAEAGDLPLSIEIDMEELQGASQQEVRRLFLVATLKALIDVANKYGLASSELEQALAAEFE